MIYPVYSIRDRKANNYSPQMIVQVNEQSAVRGFSFLVSNDKSVMGFSPFDYDLCQIGNFNDENGIFKPMMPKLIVNGGTAYEKSTS